MSCRMSSETVKTRLSECWPGHLHSPMLDVYVHLLSRWTPTTFHWMSAETSAATSRIIVRMLKSTISSSVGGYILSLVGTLQGTSQSRTYMLVGCRQGRWLCFNECRHERWQGCLSSQCRCRCRCCSGHWHWQFRAFPRIFFVDVDISTDIKMSIETCKWHRHIAGDIGPKSTWKKEWSR